MKSSCYQKVFSKWFYKNYKDETNKHTNYLLIWIDKCRVQEPHNYTFTHNNSFMLEKGSL